MIQRSAGAAQVAFTGRKADLKIEIIHHSTGYVRIETRSARGIAFLRMWFHPGRLLLLHPANDGNFWCRHDETDREQLIADAALAGLIVDDVPDDLSFWSAIPDDEDGDE